MIIYKYILQSANIPTLSKITSRLFIFNKKTYLNYRNINILLISLVRYVSYATKRFTIIYLTNLSLLNWYSINSFKYLKTVQKLNTNCNIGLTNSLIYAHTGNLLFTPLLAKLKRTPSSYGVMQSMLSKNFILYTINVTKFNKYSNLNNLMFKSMISYKQISILLILAKLLNYYVLMVKKIPN